MGKCFQKLRFLGVFFLTHGHFFDVQESQDFRIIARLSETKPWWKTRREAQGFTAAKQAQKRLDRQKVSEGYLGRVPRPGR